MGGGVLYMETDGPDTISVDCRLLVLVTRRDEPVNLLVGGDRVHCLLLAYGCVLQE